MLGRITTIPNKKRKFGSDLAYAHVRMRMPRGERVDLLVTQDELDRMFVRANCNPEDIPLPFLVRIRLWIGRLLCPPKAPTPPSKP